MAVNWTGGRKHLPTRLGQKYCYRPNIDIHHGVQRRGSSRHCSFFEDVSESEQNSFDSDQVSEIATEDREDIEVLRKRILDCPNWSAIGATKRSMVDSSMIVSSDSSSSDASSAIRSACNSSSMLGDDEDGNNTTSSDQSSEAPSEVSINVPWIIRREDLHKHLPPQNTESGKPDRANTISLTSQLVDLTQQKIESPIIQSLQNSTDPTQSDQTKRAEQEQIDDAAVRKAMIDLVTSRQLLYNTIFPSHKE